MNTEEIPVNKIYCRLLCKINGVEVFPKGYIKKNKWLYIKEKEVTKKSFGVINLKESVHFKYVNNPKLNEEIYNNYIKSANQDSHSKEKFDRLIFEFTKDKLKRNKINLKKISYKRKTYFEIIDGLHRAAIFFCRYEKITSDFFIIKNEN